MDIKDEIKKVSSAFFAIMFVFAMLSFSVGMVYAFKPQNLQRNVAGISSQVGESSIKSILINLNETFIINQKSNLGIEFNMQFPKMENEYIVPIVRVEKASGKILEVLLDFESEAYSNLDFYIFSTNEDFTNLKVGYSNRLIVPSYLYESSQSTDYYLRIVPKQSVLFPIGFNISTRIL